MALLWGEPPYLREVWGLPLYALCVGMLLTLCFLPFEILIGYAAEAVLGRTTQTLWQWLLDWSRSQLLILVGTVLGICFFGYVGQMEMLYQLAAVGASFLLFLFLIFILPYASTYLSGMACVENQNLEKTINEGLSKWNVRPLKLKILDDGGEEGVNGCIFPFFKNTFYVNQKAVDELNADELASMAYREYWFHQNGKSFLCTSIVLIWAILGLGLSITVPAAFLAATNALEFGLCGAALFTSWCFLALFIWPPLNNKLMLKADQALANQTKSDDVIKLLNKVQTLNQTDCSISSAKEFVFHPIPSLSNRIEHLQKMAS
ncbi:MAG: hypothetical protein AAF984_10225 [Verrucomicrobiota bacterium]